MSPCLHVSTFPRLQISSFPCLFTCYVKVQYGICSCTWTVHHKQSTELFSELFFYAVPVFLSEFCVEFSSEFRLIPWNFENRIPCKSAEVRTNGEKKMPTSAEFQKSTFIDTLQFPYPCLHVHAAKY
jgi:hypothetical protein